MSWRRILAVVERDLRRYRRSPVVIALSLVMPLLQLIVLGHAIGGKVRNLRLGVVDHDHGVPAVELREMFGAVAANARTFVAVPYADEAGALRDLREGRIGALLTIPADFSRNLLAGAGPRLALVENNTDQFSSSALQAALQGIVAEYNRSHKASAAAAPPGIAARPGTDATLAVVEVYPYVPYVQFLLPGVITLAILSAAMIGGGIIFMDDKARGLHEGYLVTPVTKFELILGFNLAGAAKAVLAGTAVLLVGLLLAGVPDPFAPLRLARVFLLIVLTATALIGLMFLLVVRMSDPMLPRALFGVLNILMFFPSGAVYPTSAFPDWMRALTWFNPFAYAVHAFQSLLLKGTGLAAVGGDILFLAVFSVVTLGSATLLFRRTL
jgi:ABC-2 type transport system permease protein